MTTFLHRIPPIPYIVVVTSATLGLLIWDVFK